MLLPATAVDLSSRSGLCRLQPLLGYVDEADGGVPARHSQPHLRGREVQREDAMESREDESQDAHIET